MWHVLGSTFRNDKPLFALCRQADIMPEGMGESYAAAILDDVRPLVGEYGRVLHADLLIVGDALIDAVRRDWPFLARLAVTRGDDHGVPFRPALLVLLASYLGAPSKPQIALVGAAIELGYLAA